MRTRFFLSIAALLTGAILGSSPLASSPTCYTCGVDGRCVTAQSGYSHCNGSPSGCIAWGICPD